MMIITGIFALLVIYNYVASNKATAEEAKSE